MPAVTVGAATSGNYEYKIRSDGTVEITKYNGSSTNLIIPSTIAGKKVTNIGDSTFKNCSSLTNVIIPNGITSIGKDAFRSCKSLTSITIPNSVTRIGNWAFSDCTGLTNVTILNSVTSIGDSAFAYCLSLTSVTIPGSVTSIMWGAFLGCKSIKDVYYTGNEIDWNKIKIWNDNDKLTNATIHYNIPQEVTNFKTSLTSSNSVKLTWNKVSGAKGYIIYRYDNTKKTWVRVAKTTTNSNTYTVSKLSAVTTYKFAVKAYKTVNGKEITSASYPQLTATTNLANITKVNFTSSANSVKMSWSKVTGATGYKVYYKTSKNGSWQCLKTTNNKTTSYTKTGLSKGKTYYFTVKAYRTVDGKTYNGAYTTKSVKVK